MVPLSHLLVLSSDQQLLVHALAIAEELGLTPLIGIPNAEAPRIIPEHTLAGAIIDLDDLGDIERLSALIRAIQSRHSNTLLVVIAQTMTTADEAAAFLLGADHCFLKPVSPDVFLARLRSLLRRFSTLRADSRHKAARVIEELELDVRRRYATVRGERLRLTHTEFTLLELLTRSPGKPVPLDTLGVSLWGWESDCYYVHIKCHISRIRQKLSDRQCTIGIRSIRSVGYVLERSAGHAVPSSTPPAAVQR